jgi:RND family efflux transporter MFP subunit
MKQIFYLVRPNKLASICQQIAMTFAALVLLGLNLWISGCARDEPVKAHEPAPVAVRIAPVTQQSMAQRIGYVGTVHSRREVKVLSQAAGAAFSLTGEGETVREGQILSRIAAPEIAPRASRMNAEVARAKTERDFLCETHETDEKLAASGVISKRQVDLSRKACDAASAALTAAQAGSREIGATQGKTSEQAPFDGRVLQWLVEPGQNVMPGTPLLLLGSHDLELRVQVGEKDLERGVREGVPAMVRLGDQVLRLEISNVAPMAVGPGRTSEVKIPLPNELTSTPAHGSSVRIEFLVAEAPDSLAVPQKALAKIAGKDTVFVIDNGLAQAVAVTSGIGDDGMVAVTGEITAGAWVAVSNLDLLKDNAKVFEVRPEKIEERRP